MKKLLISLLAILLIQTSIFSQRNTVKQAIPEGCGSMNRGIYLDVTEFLNNQPSISCNFEVVDYAPDYYLYPEERSAWFISYTDDMGYKKVMKMSEVFGYNDGKGIYFSYHGRPYELLQFGAISILRYHQSYHRNILAQAFSLYAIGSTVTSTERVQEVLFHVKNDTIVMPTAKSFKDLISDDRELYSAYRHDRKTDFASKPLVYLERYNTKHPVKMTDRGIEFQDLPELSEK
jgi:hypothetical protein